MWESRPWLGKNIGQSQKDSWKKKNPKNIERCTGYCDITEILLRIPRVQYHYVIIGQSAIFSKIVKRESSGLERILCGILEKKELQESMDRCTGRQDTTETTLKTALNTMQPINNWSPCTAQG